jgi:hypothetical protein
MAHDAVRARYDAFFGEDFMPLIRHEQTQGAEERIAYATEFAAFQLGQIDKKLGQLIELMERQRAATS